MTHELKIDEVDITILNALLCEPRTSFAKIARDCGLSTPSIYNRFDLLKKSGVINGSVMQIDPRSLGYNCVAMVNIQAHPKDKKIIQTFLRSQNIPFYDHHLSGNGFLSFLVAKDMDELARISKKMKDHPAIREVFPIVWVNTTNIDHPENLVIPKISFSFYPPTENDTNQNGTPDSSDCLKTPVVSEKNRKICSQTSLDSVDLMLIMLLASDARLSFRKLSETLGISTNNVIHRYKKLRKTVLKTSSITVNLEKLGYIGSGVIKIKVTDGFSVQEIFDKILKIPNIIIGIQIFAEHDILVIAPFTVFNELEVLVQEIVNISGVYDMTLLIDKPFTKWPLNTVSDAILNDLLLDNK
jgi:DNA-binding Lrp family transcriptional regulator